MAPSLPQPFTSPQASPLDPKEAVKQQAEETVLMSFPRDVMLTLPSLQRIHFTRGVHPVPASLVEHDYLRANKVERVKHTPPQSLPIVATEAHAEFFRLRGYEVPDAASAQKRLDAMSLKDQSSFMADFSADFQRLQEEAHKVADVVVKLPDDLEGRTKAELVDFGKKTFGLSLDVNSKKDELLSAIHSAAAQQKQ